MRDWETDLALLQDTLKDGATGHTTLEVVHLAARLVDVKRANDDKARGREEVALGNRDLGADVLVDDFDVVAQLG